jgi:hypothetical protein
MMWNRWQEIQVMYKSGEKLPANHHEWSRGTQTYNHPQVTKFCTVEMRLNRDFPTRISRLA